MQTGQIVTVVGGSGFVGRYVVKHLAKAGYTVRVLCRHPHLAQDLKVSGFVGQIVVDYADVAKPDTLKGKFDDSWAVINLTGILYEHGSQKFSKIQAQGAEKVARHARDAGAQHMLHMSALGIERSSNSTYARSKLEGEKAVRAAFPGATIFRPSVIFGPEDDFINYFAWLGKFSPFYPAIGGGKTRFQPVYCDDVARAFLAVLQQPTLAGQTYELGGPRVYSFSEILTYIDQTIHRERKQATIPFPLASLMGSVMQWMPGKPPITYDQVQLLKSDNVLTGDYPGLEALGIMPTAMESEVPRYLHYRINQSEGANAA